MSVHQATFDIAVTVPPVARLAKRLNLLDHADAYWDAADAAAGQIPNRVPGGPALTLTEGEFGMPIVYPYNGDPYLGSAGWDDMWATAPLLTPDAGFEVRVDHDQDFEPRQETPDWYTIVHQGADGDLSWALRRNRLTGELAVIVTYDGDTNITAEATDTPGFGIRRGHIAARVDTAAGTVDFYEQPATGRITAPLTHRSWSKIGDTVTIAAGAIHQSDLDLSISGFDLIDDTDIAAALGAYYRVRITSLDGTVLADLDPSTITLPLGPWAVVDGYPLVGTETTAKEATFPGGAGETWTIHNFETYSYPLTVVDRPLVQLGNKSYLTAEHDPLFNADTLTVAICARSYVTPGGITAFIAHTDADDDIIGGGDRGWELGYRGDAGPYMAVGDGTGVRAGSAPAPDVGDLVVLVGRLDTHTAGFTDGVTGTPITLAAFGTLDVTAPLRIAGGTGNVNRDASLDVSRVAIFARALTDLEVAALTADLLAQP